MAKLTQKRKAEIYDALAKMINEGGAEVLLIGGEDPHSIHDADELNMLPGLMVKSDAIS